MTCQNFALYCCETLRHPYKEGFIEIRTSMLEDKLSNAWAEAGLTGKDLPDQVELLKLLESTTEDLFRHNALFEAERHTLGTDPAQIGCFNSY